MSARRRGGGLVFACLLLAASIPARAEINLAAYRTIADCDAALALYPGEIDVCHCYVNLADRERSWGPAIDHLTRRLAAAPGDPLLLYARALVEASRGGEAAEAGFRAAADRFEAMGVPYGQVQALMSLFFLIENQGRYPEADAALSRAEAIAAETGDPTQKLFVLYHRGIQAADRSDFVEAARYYRAVEGEVLPDGHPVLQGMVLNALGQQARWERKLAEAIAKFERAAAIFNRIGDFAREANTRYHLADVMATAAEAGIVTQESALSAHRAARETAERSRNLGVQLLLAYDEAAEPGSADQRLERYRRLLEAARAVPRFDTAAYALRGMASLTMERDPSDFDAALELADEAIDLAHGVALGDAQAYGYIARGLLHRRRGDRERAIADWEQGLSQIEAIRDRQRDDLVEAHHAHRWAYTYYRLLAYIMERDGEAAGEGTIERALSVSERLRARRSLETLDDARATLESDDPLVSERRQVLDDLARHQRALLRKDLTDAARAALRAKLDPLEAHEASLSARIARAAPRFASSGAIAPPVLHEIRESLGEDEAILSFHVGPEDNIQGWLFLVTRAGSRAFELPASSRIDKAVSLFAGLLERRDGGESRAAASLYDLLLRPAIGALPPAVRHLILVPEGPLNLLPIDLLRDGPEGALLLDRFDLAVTPSLAAWLRWRQALPAVAELPVLALADPDLGPAEIAAAGGVRSGSSPAELGTLPLARRESAAVAGLLGRGSVVVEGADATERFLKEAPLGRYRLLHVAAHAVLDDQRPERSAVRLAPGAPEEDGLLQLREIVRLDLKDRIVVLSACSSASGTVLQGAGVMGIARGFFQAGARVVVGSLVPLRDDEAEPLMRHFAAHLAAGRSVASALAQARREMARLGMPAAAWSGVVVLGDGAMVPFPGGTRSAAGPVSLAAAAGIAGLAWLLWKIFRRG